MAPLLWGPLNHDPSHMSMIVMQRTLLRAQFQISGV